MMLVLIRQLERTADDRCREAERLVTVADLHGVDRHHRAAGHPLDARRDDAVRKLGAERLEDEARYPERVRIDVRVLVCGHELLAVVDHTLELDKIAIAHVTSLAVCSRSHACCEIDRMPRRLSPYQS